MQSVQGNHCSVRQTHLAKTSLTSHSEVFQTGRSLHLCCKVFRSGTHSPSEIVRIFTDGQAFGPNFRAIKRPDPLRLDLKRGQRAV